LTKPSWQTEHNFVILSSSLLGYVNQLTVDKPRNVAVDKAETALLFSASRRRLAAFNWQLTKAVDKMGASSLDLFVGGGVFVKWPTQSALSVVNFFSRQRARQIHYEAQQLLFQRTYHHDENDIASAMTW
jgi:hypothetical protein